jgi:lysophospholipase L1-like esterase
MLNGWTTPVFVDQARSGTEFVTIGVPDDFHAVRVGLANVNASPWTVTKIIACASSSWNDYFTPTEGDRTVRPASAWSTLTFQNGGVDCSSLVTVPGARSDVIVAGNVVDRASGETSNPAWTFTDWVQCGSIGADTATSMRVLMLRALVPGEQTVTVTNGRMTEYSATPSVNKGYGYFLGGLKLGIDLVTNPADVSVPNMTSAMVAGNHLANGQMMCLVQVLTRKPGIVGMVTGDSHQAGTTTTSQINNFLLQCLRTFGHSTIGMLPISVVNTAVGGATSQQIFPRMTALLNAVQPTFVVMPCWTFNERDGELFATPRAEDHVFTRMLLAAEQVRAAGAVPIFVTPFPRDPFGMTPEVLMSWLARREATMAMREFGEVVLDVADLVGLVADGRFTGTYRDGLSLDLMHPNDAGHAIIAEALAPIVQNIVGPPLGASVLPKAPELENSGTLTKL